ncbi:MAG: GNAT family N-acetyltransferase [Thermoanaerobacteraceae bacterium]|nr:GNAT family N-acetyltransferase [Thermoanaerobacteraceae bacterium]
MVSKGKVHHTDGLAGFVAILDDEISGIITYEIDGENCEIVSIDSSKESLGIGSRLVEAVIERANQNSCRRVWLITTNDNANAIRFFQKRGFDMAALYLNAVEEARKIKPEIPLYGYDNIPIKHEIEFEMTL